MQLSRRNHDLRKVRIFVRWFPCRPIIGMNLRDYRMNLLRFTTNFVREEFKCEFVLRQRFIEDAPVVSSNGDENTADYE